MADIELIGLRRFRETLERLTEPVQVIKTRGDVTVLGVWLPQDSDWEVTKDVDGGYVTYRYRRKVSSKR